MEQRHFVLIAAIIRDEPDAFVRGRIARSFAKRLRLINPRFKEALFFKACGVEG